MDSDPDIYDIDSEPDLDLDSNSNLEPEEEVFSDEDTIDEPIVSRNSKNYTILKGSDIRQLVKEDISKTSAILSVPTDVSVALLRHYNWNISRANEEWFASESKVRKSIGMLSEKEITEVLSRDSSRLTLTCGICFEEYSLDLIDYADCKHPYCKECWECYISASIESGVRCLVLRCPEPCCKIMVGQSKTIALASEKDRLKYYDYLYRSYVEENKKIKWCPAPGCENAVEFEIGSENYYVICDCSYGFCWNCLEENHRPIDCDTIAKWSARNRAEAENTNWILAFTKKCPKCLNSIEKNKGCMHMTCKCGYHFCWICLEKWGSCDGSCNRFKETKEVKEAKEHVQRYTHYYERWMLNEKSKQKAMNDLKEMKDERLKKLSEFHSLNEVELEFIIQAWQQIVECRRFLKWTYAYGFYLREKEMTKKQFFEYLQGQAEACLERLHECAERELFDHVGFTKKLVFTEEGSYKSFVLFRSKLTDLTNVTRNYFDKLVIALENGLEDVTNSKQSNRDTATSYHRNRDYQKKKANRNP
ncbi:hypothetical protein HAX54_047808 [Datura stramonium]|uniref:RBR-type E3 ubiquitin transferase n=1 Tax=Datura stramonium TaxID=4076 RepID=A0ABS8SUQ4_DATST|nr:hypothetical protein [Datura stramonium]